MLSVQHVLDNIVLKFDGWGISRRSITFQGCKHVKSLVVSPLSDQKSWRIGKPRTHAVECDGEDDLECQRESPRYGTGSEGTAKSQPIGEGESGNALGL